MGNRVSCWTDRQKASLKASYSDRIFSIVGSPNDDSVFNPIAIENGNWEPHVMDVMASLVRPTDVCLDIGANLGAHTMVLADLASQGNVYAFEPSSLNARYLRENIETNKLHNARCVQIALGRAQEVKELTNIPGWEGASFVSPDGDKEAVIERAWPGRNLPTTTESVDVDTLDHWMAQNAISHVDFVKMDVEGSEPAVLEGGLATFERFHPKLIVEFNRNSLSFYYGERPSQFYDRLSELYPFIYIIHDERGIRPTRVTYFKKIEPLLDLPDHWWVDLLCLSEPYEHLARPRMLVTSSQPPRRKVVYFSRFDLSRVESGGYLICRNTARRIAQTDGVDLTICGTGPSGEVEGTSTFANSIGAKFVPIVFKEWKAPDIWTRLRRRLFVKSDMMHELEAKAFRHVDEEFSELLDSIGPDTLVIDYLYSAMYIPSAFKRRSLRRVTFTLNREVAFARDKRLRGLLPDASLISELRLFFYEQMIYSRSNSVIALTSNDLPAPRPMTRRFVLPAVFDPKVKRWNGASSKSLFFVGNVNHYPNKEAVEWIVSRLAPALLNLNSSATIDIIGSTHEQISSDASPANVRYHGVASYWEAVQKFTDCGLFIAPIKNNFGSKIKLLDCLSYGTPFAASKAALSGLPFLNGVPLLDLEDPVGSAQTLDALLNDSAKRASMSSSIAKALNDQLQAQAKIWEMVLS
jgi:FkbM family methyltransferase